MANKYEIQTDNFQHYLTDIDDDLVGLSIYIQEYLRKDTILDYSINSLSYVEDFLDYQFNNYNLHNFSVDKLIEIVSFYMGEIVRKKVGGKWAICLDEEDIDYGYPMLHLLQGFPDDFGWSPIQVVLSFKETRKKGLLKQATNGVLNAFK